MWALTRRPISSPELLSALAAWKHRNGFDSDCWALPRDLPFFGARARIPFALDAERQQQQQQPTEAEGRRLTVPFELLGRGPVRAVPMVSLHPQLRASLLRAAPPPPVPDTAPYILEPVPETGGEGLIAWRECTLDELHDASLHDSAKASMRSALLCATALLPDPPAPRPVTLLNAQETTNPFAVDPDLRHVNAESGAALPDCLASSLTTIARQFHYASVRWLPAEPPRSRARDGALSLPPAAAPAHAQPHRLSTMEPVLLAHLSQLPPDEQRALLSFMPRHILFKAAALPFVFADGRWLHAYRINLERRLRAQDVPGAAGNGDSDGDAQPLLWVLLAEGDVDGITGPPLRLQRMVHRHFFNAAQVDAGTGGALSGEASGEEARPAAFGA